MTRIITRMTRIFTRMPRITFATVLVIMACAAPEREVRPDTPPQPAGGTPAASGAGTPAPSPRSDTGAPVVEPYNPDDSGPADNAVTLALWEDRKRRGVDFFGVGQEPGWIIEIDEGRRIYMLANYAEDTIDVAAPAPVAEPAVPGRRTYRAAGGGHTLVVTIEPKPCADAMSGKRYAETVTVTLDGRTFDGCGRKVQ